MKIQGKALIRKSDNDETIVVIITNSGKPSNILIYQNGVNVFEGGVEGECLLKLRLLQGDELVMASENEINYEIRLSEDFSEGELAKLQELEKKDGVITMESIIIELEKRYQLTPKVK